MTKLFRMAAHEFIKHLRRPSFLIITALVPLIGAAVTLALGGQATRGLPGTSTSAQLANFHGSIGYVDAAGVIKGAPHEFPPTLFRAYPDENAARAAVASGEVSAFYVIPRNYLQSGAITRYARQLQLSAPDADLFKTLLRTNLLGGQLHDAALLDQPLTLETVKLDAAGNVSTERNNANASRNPLVFVVPYVFALLLYMTVFFAASFMLQSVTEEKENRTIEIVLTSVRPWQLLGGKVLGLGLLGLIQMLIWLASGRLLLGVSMGPLGMFDQGFALPWTVWALAVVYFLLGYLVYASIMAGIGATVTTMREGSQLTALVALPFIFPLWFLGVIIEQPNGLLARGLSIFPLTAPVTMMIRVPLTDVAPAEIALSLVLLAVFVVLGIWLAARLFRVTTLLAGKRLDGREIVRAIRAG